MREVGSPRCSFTMTMSVNSFARHAFTNYESQGRMRRNLVQFRRTTVDALRIRNDELDLLDEHLQTRTRITRGRHANLRVLNTGRGVFVIYMCLNSQKRRTQRYLQLLRLIILQIHCVL